MSSLSQTEDGPVVVRLSDIVETSSATDRGRFIPSDKRLLSRRELAALLGVCVRTITKMRQSGRLPKPVCDGQGLVRWDRRDIERWIKANKK